MLTGLNPTSRPTSVLFAAKKAVEKQIPIDPAVSWVEGYSNETLPKAALVTDKNKLREYISRMPVPAIFPPPPGPDLTKKVGILVRVLSTSGSQDLSSPSLVLDEAKKELRVNVAQNVSNGGVSMVVKTSNLFFLVDKANLPKNPQTYKMTVNVTKN